jgi:hypothetical protein
MNSLETRLHSWRPRRPSARLDRRIFSAPAGPVRKLAWAFGSLAPVTACALLTLSAFNSGNSGISPRQEPVTAMILSNPQYAAYASDTFHEQQNSLFSVTFDWTRSGSFTSSIAPFLQDRMH